MDRIGPFEIYYGSFGRRVKINEDDLTLPKFIDLMIDVMDYQGIRQEVMQEMAKRKHTKVRSQII